MSRGEAISLLPRCRGCLQRFQSSQTKGTDSSVKAPRRHGSEGFTLVELLIVVTIMPLIIGAISLGLIMVFSLQNGVSSRITDASDAQVASSTFLKDVQSAAMITEEPALACGASMPNSATQTQLLGLEWGGNGGSYVKTVSYITEQNSGLSSYSLIRQLCTNGITSTASSVSIVATDLASDGASALPTIQCASHPVDNNCAASPGFPNYFLQHWMNTGDVQYVLLSAQEHALLPRPNNSTPFVLTLSAAPRFHIEAASTTTSNASSPLTVLGTSCLTPALEILNNVTVSINVGGGIGNGSLGLGANCKSVQVDNGGALNAGSVLTTNQSLNSVLNYPSGTVYPVPEYFTPTIADPYSGLSAPPTGVIGLTPGTCTQTAGVWNCSAGYYAQDPGSQYFGNGSGQTINFTTTNCTPDASYQNACRFLFENGLTLPGNSNDDFATGVYVFQPNSSGLAFTGNPGVNINGANNGSSTVLFYIASGAASFAPGLTIDVAGFPGLDGVTIWDADTSNPLVLGNNSSGGVTTTGYGGIYAPNDQVQINNDQNGTITMSFVVAQSLVFKQNLTINIVQP